ncbi:hypothetical protein D3C78_1813190 [compost metagenome]
MLGQVLGLYRQRRDQSWLLMGFDLELDQLGKTAISLYWLHEDSPWHVSRDLRMKGRQDKTST